MSMALRSAGGVYGLLPTVIGRICFESQVNKWFAYVYEGYAKRPSKQNAYSEGLWVSHVERYPLLGKVISGPPFEMEPAQSLS